MQKCPFCGAQIQDNANRCQHCDAIVGTGQSAQAGAGWKDTMDNMMTRAGNNEVVFGNQYRVVRKLGEGAMGMVYLCMDTEMHDRQVAIKVLPPILSRNERAVMNLRREAVTAIELTHPNIIRLYGFHTDGDVKFLVMEYIDGVTLEQLISRAPDNRLGIERTVKYISEIASALDYAHSRSPAVIHRDLKPSNIMIDKADTVRVLDFGIARQMRDSYTRVTGQIETSGTLPYMSPEQLRGRGAAVSMDLYSLAAVCYECLSGRPPFSTGDISYQIINEPLPEIERVDEHINKALQNALAKNPEQRPKSAHQFVKSLKQPEAEVVKTAPAENKPVPAPVVKPAKKDKKPKKPQDTQKPKEPKKGKKRKVLIPLVVLLIIISIAGGVVFAMWDRIEYHIERADYDIPATENIADNKQYKYADILGVPAVRTFHIGLSAPVSMILIPPGEFEMGASPGDDSASTDEVSAGTVVIDKAFYMGQFEVTQGQWHSVMGSSIEQEFREKEDKSEFDQLWAVGVDYPMYYVTWAEALEFCEKLSQRTGENFYLPTEAQWEYAARSDVPKRFFFGSDNWEVLKDVAWLRYNSDLRPHPVGQKFANMWWLYDIYGNVSEWVLDWYSPRYEKPSYKGGRIVNPIGPVAGDEKVIRGGSFLTEPPWLGASRRNKMDPAEKKNFIGFRVIMEIPKGGGK